MVYTTHLWESWGWWILLLNMNCHGHGKKKHFHGGMNIAHSSHVLMTVHGLVHHPRTKMISTASRI